MKKPERKQFLKKKKDSQFRHQKSRNTGNRAISSLYHQTIKKRIAAGVWSSAQGGKKHPVKRGGGYVRVPGNGVYQGQPLRRSGKKEVYCQRRIDASKDWEQGRTTEGKN